VHRDIKPDNIMLHEGHALVADFGIGKALNDAGSGTLTETGVCMGTPAYMSPGQADWGDWDNDGDLDLFVASYVGSTPDQQPANALFSNDGAGHFTDILPKESALNAADHSVQFVDYNHDGGLDLSITDGYGPVGGHFLFRNTLPEETKRRSLSVLVLDANGHHTRFGAEIRLFDSSGRILATRPVVTWGGYNSQMAAPVHFGLRSMAPVRVEVTFMSPDGRRTQTVDGVDPADYRGTALVIRESR
jgi:hypothetical protein